MPLLGGKDVEPVGVRLWYRGSSAGIVYTGFNWMAKTYLTEDFETAAIYGRLGRVERARMPSRMRLTMADDPVVRSIEASAERASTARKLGVEAIWNPASHWVGRVHPHECVVYGTGVRFGPITKVEQARAVEIAAMLRQP